MYSSALNERLAWLYDDKQVAVPCAMAVVRFAEDTKGVAHGKHFSVCRFRCLEKKKAFPPLGSEARFFTFGLHHGCAA